MYDRFIYRLLRYSIVFFLFLLFSVALNNNRELCVWIESNEDEQQVFRF